MIKPLLVAMILNQTLPIELIFPKNPYSQAIPYSRCFSYPVITKNKSTFDNMIYQEDVNMEQNQKILDLLFKEIKE